MIQRMVKIHQNIETVNKSRKSSNLENLQKHNKSAHNATLFKTKYDVCMA